MTETDERLEAFTGERKVPTAFEHLDMAFNLRMRGFIPICMPAMWGAMEREVGMRGMRREGIAHILFYVDFSNTATPLSFGRSLHTGWDLRLYRSCTDDANQPVPRGEGTERLLFESHTLIRGRKRAADGEAEEQPLVEAGRARILHVLTRPTAPAGERQVLEVPDDLRMMREHAWDGPLPTVENLDHEPEGYAAVETGGHAQTHGVWGMPNTDVNQHVNVLEYVMVFENQLTRQLHAGGLTVAGHRLSRLRLLFRKPFFPGQPYVVATRLYRSGRHTRMVGGVYGVDSSGAPSRRPSAFGIADGVLPEGAVDAQS